MMTSQLETTDVSLYYTVRGSGPMLLILQGGAGNADGSEALANELSSDFTVVTYDRRGLSRSTPIRAERYEIATHADDAAQLIGAGFRPRSRSLARAYAASRRFTLLVSGRQAHWPG